MDLKQKEQTRGVIRPGDVLWLEPLLTCGRWEVRWSYILQGDIRAPTFSSWNLERGFRDAVDVGLHIRTNVVDGHVFPVCATLPYLRAKRFTVFYYDAVLYIK